MSGKRSLPSPWASRGAIFAALAGVGMVLFAVVGAWMLFAPAGETPTTSRDEPSTEFDRAVGGRGDRGRAHPGVDRATVAARHGGDGRARSRADPDGAPGGRGPDPPEPAPDPAPTSEPGAGPARRPDRHPPGQRSRQRERERQGNGNGPRA